MSTVNYFSEKDSFGGQTMKLNAKAFHFSTSVLFQLLSEPELKMSWEKTLQLFIK